jgi:hypothetical protein
MNINDFYDGMEKYFSITNPSIYLIVQLSTVERVCFNLVKFDDNFLIPRFGDYTREQGKSIQQIVAEKFGEDAANFVKNTLSTSE